MNKSVIYAVLALFLWLAGCVSNEQVLEVPSSEHAATPQVATDEELPGVEATAETDIGQAGMERLRPLPTASRSVPQEDWSHRFADDDELQLAVEEMPLEQFLHYAFGELLGVNYVISDGLQNLDAPLTLKRQPARSPAQLQQQLTQMPSGQTMTPPSRSDQKQAASNPMDLDAPVTINLQQSVSSRRLYTIAIELLAERNVRVTFRDGIYYLHPFDWRGKGGVAIGVGSGVNDVPDMPGPIMQIIPLRYGMTVSLERTVRDMVNADVIADLQQGAMFVTGERSEILRVLDLVALLDQPAQRGRHIGLVSLTFIAADDYMDRIVELLSAEGVPVSIGPGDGRSSIALVTLESIGGVAVFAATRQFLDRVDYWTRKLDKPAQGAKRSYFIYTPRYARADELGQSLVPLLGDAEVSEIDSEPEARDTRSALGNNEANSVVQGALSNRRSDFSSRSAGQDNPAPVSVRSGELTMSVDLRSNALIFNTTGTRYQALLPMIRRLDTPPRQILIDAMIAEVQLTDEFAMGVEFLFQSGDVEVGTTGGLGLPSGGGFISIVGSDGAVRAQLSASNRLVNILSNPSLVVRDGTSATISVGNDIPTVGATFFDPIVSDTQITTVQYRKTGVNLTVRPTLNAQGLVVMEIIQDVSNTVEGGSEVEGTPAIFERSLKTEVVARSGETVLLGGLISEIKNNTVAKVPGLGDIPWLGRLFRSDSESTERTELVVMITPKVLDENTRWSDVVNKMDSTMRYISLQPTDISPQESGEKTTE